MHARAGDPDPRPRSRPTTTRSRRAPCWPAHAIARGAVRRGRAADRRDRAAQPRAARGFGGAFVTGDRSAPSWRWPGRHRRGAAALPGGRRGAGSDHGCPGMESRPGWSRGRCSARRPAPRRTPCTAPATDGRGPVRARCAPRRRGCSTRTGPTWTTRSPAWCCTGSAPGGCSSEAMDAEDAVRLLVLAELFAYPRFTATMDPERTDDEAERVAPGLAARLRAEYGERKGPDLLPEARAVAERIAGCSRATSCGCRSGPRAAGRSPRPRAQPTQRPADLGGDLRRRSSGRAPR